MSTKKRTFLAILAGLGWGGAFTIIAASLFVEAITDNSFFYGRLFALLGMGAMVLTLGLWMDHTRYRAVPQPVEMAYRLGVRAGVNIARVKARAEVRNYTPDLFAEQIINGQGQDTPPIGWPRR